MLQTRQLETEIRDLEHQLRDSKQKYEAIESRERDRECNEGEKHREEVAQLKDFNTSLRTELERLMSIPSKTA